VTRHARNLTHMSDTALGATTPEYLKPREVAARYKLSMRLVYDLMNAREIDRVEVGMPGSRKPVLRTTAASVDAYLARRTTAAEAAS
jgi:hypothetical protein